jgi:NADH-quinone oxidoreductase subunit D
MVTNRQEFLINMGPQHPSTHGVFRLVLDLDGETVVSAEPEIGFLHRGMEKISENRTYEQVLPLTDRLDYLNSMGNNIAYTMAVEKLAGIEVPERALYIRVIMAELNRIASHLISIGTQGLEVGAYTVFLHCFRERERILDLFEMASGARLTYSYFRFGGVSRDLPDGWADEARAFLDLFLERVDEYETLLIQNPIYLKRARDIGVITRELALSYGASGPVLRSTGIPWDLRKTDPYLVYDRFDFDIPVGEHGDVWERSWIRLEEMRQSVAIIRQALDTMPEGPVQDGYSRYVVPPAGYAYVAVESPRGELGFFVVSDGGAKPFRLKVRSPAFVNLSLVSELVSGVKIADVPLIIGSLDPVFGEVDR